jgi:hypothetical protein
MTQDIIQEVISAQWETISAMPHSDGSGQDRSQAKRSQRLRAQDLSMPISRSLQDWVAAELHTETKQNIIYEKGRPRRVALIFYVVMKELCAEAT